MSIHRGYQPKTTIANPKPPGPENVRVRATFGGFEKAVPPPPPPPPPRLIKPNGEVIGGAKKLVASMEPMSIYMFSGFMFCAFSLGIAVSANL